MTHKKGFTIVELLVSISIIAILSAIVLANISDSRARARDSQRIAELAQLELALEQYWQIHDSGFPAYDSGIEIGAGGGIDDDLSSYLSDVPADPKADTGGGGDYQYYYDSAYTCNGDPDHIALFAIKVEHEDASNLAAKCGTGSDSGDIGASEDEVYVIILR